jgi:hypothetical protein
MRIIIDIDPEGITVRTSEAVDEQPLVISADRSFPPQDVLERAERIGAFSAGAAPVRLGFPDLAAAKGPGEAGARAESMDAGVAEPGSDRPQLRTTKAPSKGATRTTRKSKR